MSHLTRRGICVLMSGGLDSAVLLHRVQASHRRVAPLYVRCGLRWEAAERYWLRRYLKAVRVPGLEPLRVAPMSLPSLYGAHWSLTGRGVPSARSVDSAVYLPGRNVLLLSAAAILCAQQGLSTIALGILKGNPFGDASPEFLAQMARCLTIALRHPIRIVAPLRQLSKTDLLRSRDTIPFELTFSCLRPRGRLHCGRCNKCAERARAFRTAGVWDPTRYANR